jgi:pimeloyl-ACP methyl ester carboxylesterase
MQSRVADLDGPVYYTDFGGDGPLLVLLHGLGSDHVAWTPAGLLLRERFRVVAVDLPGFGRSLRAGRSVHVASQAEIVSAFVAHVDDGPAILVGSSMGGLVALLTAVASPGRVAGVVGVSPVMPVGLAHTLTPQASTVFLVPSLPIVGTQAMRAGWRLGSPAGQLRRVLDAIAGEQHRISEPLRTAMTESFSEWAASDGAAAGYADAVRSQYRYLTRRRDFDRLSGEVVVPTLLLHGTDDPLIPPGAAERVAALRPEWSLEMIPGCGHLPHAEAPGRFAAAVAAWVERVDVRGRGGGTPRRG